MTRNSCIRRNVAWIITVIMLITVAIPAGFSAIAATTGTSYTQNFTTDGLDSSFYTITGNLSTSKGTVTYNGLTLTTCLKMESSTSITFTAPSDGTLKMVFLSTDTDKDVKVNGTKYATDDDGILEVDISAGSVSVTKGDVCYLYYMVFTSDGSEEETDAEEETTTESSSEETDTDYATGLVTNVSSIADSEFVNKIYVSANASSSGTGTSSSPMTLENAISEAEDTDGVAILLQSGTYSFDSQITISYDNNGTSSKYKVLRAAEGATVTLDFSDEEYGDTSSNDRGLQLEGSYWYIADITITGAADNGMFISGNYNVIEGCIFEANRDSGLQISRRNSSLSDIDDWPSYNYVINCTSFDNNDPATNENADGFACKLTAGPGNVFDGCISYCNIDDGWDLYAKSATGSIGVVTIRNCVAFKNGTLTDGTTSTAGDRNGFKLGGSNGAVPTAHVIFNCLAFDNGKDGFTDNGNGASLTLTNCTSSGNSGANFNFYRTTAGGTFTNIISIDASSTDKFIGTLENSIYYNSSKYYFISSITSVESGDKTGTVISALSSSEYVSTSSPSANSSVDSNLRNSDGTIDMNGYLATSSSSDYSTMGAKFGGDTDTKTVNVYTN